MRVTLFFLICLVGVAGRAQGVNAVARPIHVALVVDDGPVPGKSAKFVEVFKDRRVRATFSFVASALERDPADGRNVVAAGFEVNNHSFDHLHPAQLGEAALEREIGGAQACFRRILGESPRFYWQPHHELDARIVYLVAKHDLELVNARRVVSTHDFMPQVTGPQIFRNATDGIRDGTVIVFHEWREETLEQMPAIIDRLRQQGCVFMTLSDLVNYLVAHGG